MNDAHERCDFKGNVRIRISIFENLKKNHEIFCENPRIIFVLFYDVHKENMFTINLEDGRPLRLV